MEQPRCMKDPEMRGKLAIADRVPASALSAVKATSCIGTRSAFVSSGWRTLEHAAHIF
jgi:hypothetical protein